MFCLLKPLHVSQMLRRWINCHGEMLVKEATCVLLTVLGAAKLRYPPASATAQLSGSNLHTQK